MSQPTGGPPEQPGPGHAPWQAPDQNAPSATWQPPSHGTPTYEPANHGAIQPYAQPYNQQAQPYGQYPQPHPAGVGLVLPYPLASTGDRLVQGLIDMLLITVPYFLLVAVAITCFVLSGVNQVPALAIVGVVVMILAVLAVWGLHFYHQAYRPHRNADQTFGMERKNLRVMKLTGEPLTLGDHALRWLMYVLIDGGLVALILIAATQHKQRLGDMVAKTVVVQLPPSP